MKEEKENQKKKEAKKKIYKKPVVFLDRGLLRRKDFGIVDNFGG